MASPESERDNIVYFIFPGVPQVWLYAFVLGACASTGRHQARRQPARTVPVALRFL